PDLLAGDDVVVALADGAAAQRREVGAHAGLGVAGAPLHLPVEDLGDEALLLLRGAVLDDRRPDPGEAHEARAEGRRVPPRALLLQDHLLHQRPAAAADLARPREADPALLAHRALPLAREAGATLALGRELRVEEGAHLRAEGLLFGREVEVHQSPPSRATRS